MKRIALLAISLMLQFQFAQAIVIIPPVVYFVTLSISTFLSSALVSLLLYGGLKGIADRKFFGKNAYQLLLEAKGAISNGLLALISMFAAVFAIYPVDAKSAIEAAALAGGLFLIIKAILSIRRLANADGASRRSLVISWLVLAAFIGLATGISAMVSMQTYRIHTGFGGYLPAQIQENNALEPLADLISGVKAPQLGVSKSGTEAKAGAAKSEDEAAGAPLSSSPQASPSIGNGSQASPAPLPSTPAPVVLNKLWFLPKSGEACKIFGPGYSQDFTPTFNCISEGIRIFCPIEVPFSQVNSRGEAQFIGTGSCEGMVEVTVTDLGFENIR